MAKADPDISEFIQLTQRCQKKPCRIGIVLEKLKPEDRRKLEAALAEDKSIVSGGAVKQWLVKHKLESYIGEGVYAISHHRARKCTCYV